MMMRRPGSWRKFRRRWDKRHPGKEDLIVRRRWSSQLRWRIGLSGSRDRRQYQMLQQSRRRHTSQEKVARNAAC